MLGYGPRWRDLAGSAILMHWAPPDVHHAAHVNRVFVLHKSAIYLGYMLHASLSDDPHLAMQLQQAQVELGVLLSAVRVTESIRREHLLSGYRLFLLPRLESPPAVLLPSRRMVERLDTFAQRALAACAGRGGALASEPALRELLAVFETLGERRRRGLAAFALSFAHSLEQFAETRGALALAFLAEGRADSITVAISDAVAELGLGAPPTADVTPKGRRLWRSRVAAVARAVNTARRDAIFATPPPELALLAAARPRMTHRWRRQGLLCDTSGGPSSLLLAVLSASWRGAPAVRSPWSSARGRGPPPGVCDWCGNRHACDAATVLFRCDGRWARTLRGDLPSTTRSIYDEIRRVQPRARNPVDELLRSIFGPSADSTEALTANFTATVGARELDLADSIEALPPASRRAAALARAERSDSGSDGQSNDSDSSNDDMSTTDVPGA